MAVTAMWMHGSALAVQSPGDLASDGRLGWGADLLVQPGKSVWMHIQVPTPVLVEGVQASLLRVFFLFEAFGGRFDMVHVWDGSTRLQRFDGLNLSGKHLAVDGVNRFDLSTSRPVGRGIGVSARFIAPIGFDTPIPPTRVIVGATGGDFEI